MTELVSIAEAARRLDRDPSRVRALVASGQLPAIKIGKSWAVDRNAVDRRKRAQPHAGRPFEAQNAWAVLFLASGHDVKWLGSGALWRQRNALALDGLDALRPRLCKRADTHRFHGHPGELLRLLEHRALARSGISAAGSHGLELVSGDEVDGYIAASELDRFQSEHALEAVDRVDANVVLRVVPDSAWHCNAVAPLAAVALDLAEDPDPRSARVGAQVLKRLDHKIKGQSR